MSDRNEHIARFLSGTHWQNWPQRPVAGDASARRYLRLSDGKTSVILMDAPPSENGPTQPFADMAAHLLQSGLAAPEVFAHDPATGLMVIGDLGKTDFAAHLRQSPKDEIRLYKAATEVLIKLAAIQPPQHLTRMTPDVATDMIDVLCPHYTKADLTVLKNQLRDALASYAPEPNTLALRDFHAENLIWRPALAGHARVGLLDFQDAFVAPAGYDLVSLLRDARRDMSDATMLDCRDHYIAQTGAPTHFPTTLACLGVARNLRILGVFARLAKSAGKTRYLAFLSRVWAHLLADLADPALQDLRRVVLDTLPAPDRLTQ